ncbi:MAG TPA: MFS transporter [Bacteroidales bacterium]|nr:MFS transporter [Bacteroidales bacterium]HQH41480.1 MFS transporter [Bacteroidales bacterium]HQK36464.1 MFS transporter [Bacteroidales bacterium]
MNSNVSLQERIGNYRWTICALIFFATTVNYLDRQVIGILKPLLKTDLGIGEAEYGYIVTAFQLAYAIGMIFAGRIIDKIGTKIGYALSLILWSIAAMAHALAKGPVGFGAARAFLGISEAGNFPAAIKTVAEWFPKKERALATGIFNSGTNIGAIIAPIVVPWLAAKWGWQMAFIATGAIGFIWLIFWFIFYEVPEKQKRLSSAELAYIKSDQESEEKTSIPWLTLLKYRQTWAFVIGKFLTDPIWWFYLFWIPGWLHDVRGLDIKSFGLPLVVIYTATTIGSIFGGWLSSFMISRGVAVYKSRRRAMLLFALLVIPIVFTQTKGISLWSAIALISLAAACHQAWSANIFTTVSDMFPKNAVASVTGIGGMAGAVGGMLVAVFAGNVLEFWEKKGSIQTGYLTLFIIAGTAYLIAWILFNLVAKKMEPVVIETNKA